MEWMKLASAIILLALCSSLASSANDAETGNTAPAVDGAKSLENSVDTKDNVIEKVTNKSDDDDDSGNADKSVPVDDDEPLQAPPPTPRTMPATLMNFQQFKTVFGRKYGSLVEELRRQKLYLARFLRSKVSWLKFYTGKAMSFLGINRMSDWTDEERAKMKNKLLTEEEKAKLGAQKGGEEKHASRRKRAIVDDDDDDLRSSVKRVGLGLGKKFTKMFKSNNMPMDRKSTGVDLRSTKCFKSPLHQGQCGACYAITTIAMFEYLYCRLNQGETIEFSEQYVIDCGHKAYTGLKIEGCEGGNINAVADFVETMGFEKAEDWPYVAHDNDKCPYLKSSGKRLHKKAAGFMKFRDAEVVEVPLGEFDMYLRKKIPLYVSIWTNDNTFLDYAGGVDSGKDCVGGDTHAVLLVGSGNQDGADYWLIRNSYGAEWGEGGHYKLDKRSGCIANGQMGRTLDALRSLSKKAFKSNTYYEGIPGRTRVEPDSDDEPEPEEEKPKEEKPKVVKKRKEKKKSEPAPSDDHYVGMWHYTSYDDEPGRRGPAVINPEHQHYEQHIDHDYYNRMNEQVSSYFSTPEEPQVPEYPKIVPQEEFVPYDWENGRFDLFSSIPTRGYRK